MNARWFTAGLVILSMFGNGRLPAQKPYRGAEYRTIATMTYGRFEVRMRSANVSGMLASFFTYYDPASPWNEIDIELMGRYNDEAQFNTIVPTQGDNHVFRQKLVFNPHAAFHVYAIEWTPHYVAWLVDGVERYRQTGAHVSQITRPQKLMMNVWQPSDAGWAGTFTPSALPVYAYYDWVRYYAYTPDSTDEFSFRWSDDFNAFDTGRWQKATHTWTGNNAQFVQENDVFQDGYLILCLTSNSTSGYSGAAVTDADVDAPILLSARAYDAMIRLLFSEPLEKATAEDPAHYSAAVVAVQQATLLPGGRSVDLRVSGDMSLPFFIFVQGINDTASVPHTMGLQYVKVVLPLQFPVNINVGGPATGSFLADSVWSFAKEYGAVGGTAYQRPSSLTIDGTQQPEIYRSGLSGLAGYNIRLADGAYDVTLMMAETESTSAGQRVFSASVEGVPVFSNLDLVQEYGVQRAVDKTASHVVVNDGILTIRFSASAGMPLLSGVSVNKVISGVGMRRDAQPRLQFDVFPNPFNASATVLYALPGSGAARFSVYDILGREVSSRPLDGNGTGEQRYFWNATGLPSGTYICRLAQGGLQISKRVVLVK
ncbi:MAG: family 16 glycosylhydrolase [Bacteroidota bacterium]